MSDFEPKDRINVSLNQEARERMREIQDHLKENYNGMAHFVRQKLHEEQALSVEERIRRKEQERQMIDKDLQQLKQVKNERETQDKLRDKRELLKEKQTKLKQIQKNGLKSREEIVEEEIQKRVDRGYSVDENDDDVRLAVDRRMENRPDVDELVESVRRLQGQVADLNGGAESYFMDLEKVEVEA